MSATRLLFWLLAHPGLAAPPPTFPVGPDLKVAHGTSLETVSLASVVDLSKPTVVHLVTDYCEITKVNLQHLSSKADEFPDVNFVAILWFLGGSNSKQFFCPADRKGVDCTEDDPKGMLLKEVAAYLPSGSKVKVVQDIQKPSGSTGSSSSDSCVDDVSTDNCKTMQGAGFNCNDDAMKTGCKLTCGICTAAPTTTTQAPKFVPPTCDWYCGAVWNQFGSTGSPDGKWNMKDMIITYVAGGCYLATVNPPSSNNVPGPKLWDGDLKTKVDDAIAAVAKAPKCAGGATSSSSSPSPSPESPPPAPAATVSSAGLGLQASILATLVIPSLGSW